MKNSSLLLLFALFYIALPAQAQRKISYEMLAARKQPGSSYLNHFVIPSETPNKSKLVIAFRLDYPVLLFKRELAGTDETFHAAINITADIFEGRSPGADKRADRLMESYQSLERKFFQKEITVNSYEITQSVQHSLQGFIEFELNPGDYFFSLNLIDENQSGMAISPRTNVTVPQFDSNRPPVTFFRIEPKEIDEPPFTLINMGRFYRYGKSIDMIFYGKSSDLDGTKLFIEQIQINQTDTTALKTLYESENLSANQRNGVRPSITLVDNQLELDFIPSTTGLHALRIPIPSHHFPNGQFRMQLRKVDSNEVLLSRVFANIWTDMPISLFSLDVAIDMLQYFANKEEMKDLRKGKDAEKEQKFRAFWKKRDPSPDTEYNEMMVEYYHRIDKAFELYSTVNIPGYASDRGKTYIRMGPPDKTERLFPPGKGVIEVWTYGNRQLRFQAISGFGDFELIK